MPDGQQTPDSSRNDRTYDIVLLGATGFTGELTAAYLAEHAPADCRWALAGRNQAKLEAVRERLATNDPALAELPLVIADSGDAASLRSAGRLHPRGHHHRRALPRVRRAAGRRLRRRRHRLRRPDRRARVRRPDVPRPPRDRRPLRGPASCTAAASTRSRTTSGALYTVKQLPADGPISVRGVVRAEGMASGGTFHSALAQFARGRQMSQAAKARRSLEPRPEGRRVAQRRHEADARLEARLLAAPAADHRPGRGQALGRGAQRVRPGRSPTPTSPAARPCGTPSAVPSGWWGWSARRRCLRCAS